MARAKRNTPEGEALNEDRGRIRAILTMRLGPLGFAIDRHLQFHGSFPYDVLDHHTVALAVDEVRVGASGFAAKVTVSIRALLDHPPLRARRAGDRSPRRTEVKEFTGTVQIQGRGTNIEEFGNIELVPPAKLLSSPEDL